VITAQYNRLNVHCSASDRAVVKRAHRMLSKRGKSAAQREARHKWLRAILAEHHQWQATVRWIR
jgi:hypothetical protein